jgi:hypothetical protein
LHELEQAIVEYLHQLWLPTAEIAAWFRTTLEENLADLLSHQRRRAATLVKRKSELVAMQDRLLNAYLAGTVDDDAFKAKTAELKADTARVTEEIDVTLVTTKRKPFDFWVERLDLKKSRGDTI